MDSTIWKYELEVTDRQQIEMPQGAKILTVQLQNGKPCLWAVVNPNHTKEIRVIKTFGTGNPFDVYSDYIGTYQLVEKGLVFHVFSNPV